LDVFGGSENRFKKLSPSPVLHQAVNHAVSGAQFSGLGLLGDVQGIYLRT
jgi:hypothetical protein